MNLLFWAFCLWLLTISEKCLSSSPDPLLGEGGHGPMVHTGAGAGAGAGSSAPRPVEKDDLLFVKGRVECPELWQLYQAYYDTLYCRTRNEDGSFRKDEHILTRDDCGNLVSLYDGDGNLRADPIVVYCQAEFQVIEENFMKLMELMREKFEEPAVHQSEEQRGLIY